MVFSFLQLSVESRLKLEVAYYNEMLSVWEPLLEPVPDNGKYRRWELQLEVWYPRLWQFYSYSKVFWNIAVNP